MPENTLNTAINDLVDAAVETSGITTPRKKAGAMVREKIEKYTGPTALTMAACGVIVWLGSVAVAPVFESQREINQANAEAARANADSVRKFADAIQSLQGSMMEQRSAVQELQRSIATQAAAESSHHDATNRVLQGIVAVQEDIARRLRESKVAQGGP